MSKSYSDKLWTKYKDFGIGIEEKCFIIIKFSQKTPEEALKNLADFQKIF